MRKQLTISEVLKLLNISIHTIRYYEKEGLISPISRTDGGYRLYDMDGEFKIVKKPRVVIIPLEKVEEALYDSPKKLYDFYIKQGGGLFADYDSALYFTMIDGYLYISSRVTLAFIIRLELLLIGGTYENKYK